jgi:hypothetical protein
VNSVPSWPTLAAESLLVPKLKINLSIGRKLTESDDFVALIDEPFHCAV